LCGGNTNRPGGLVIAVANGSTIRGSLCRARQALASIPLGLAIEYGVIYVLCYFFNREYNLAFTALIGLAGLYVFRFGNWLLLTIRQAIMYYLTKGRWVNDTVAAFYRTKMPVNDDTMFADGTDALAIVAQSETASPQAKQYALLTMGELNAVSHARPITMLQVCSVIDAAWDRYRSEANARGHTA
jgi:hypothetical protein